MAARDLAAFEDVFLIDHVWMFGSYPGTFGSSPLLLGLALWCVTAASDSDGRGAGAGYTGAAKPVYLSVRRNGVYSQAARKPPTTPNSARKK